MLREDNFDPNKYFIELASNIALKKGTVKLMLCERH